ncbi:MAG: excinuclease ABC subunit UvrA [Chloroflexi bacterium]|nr:excinuclease ABC subunit UvrA [Chloroflexota bacterium]
MQSHISISGARLHNLKSVNVDIPVGQFVVLTGVSGSGKSTFGFDIVLMEGQRQYLEAVGMLTRGVGKAPVDSIVGLLPTISVDHSGTNRSPRSTVGTATDIYTYVRVLFERLGQRPCPACGRTIPPMSEAMPDDWSPEDTSEHDPETTYIACPHCGAAVPELTMGHFSFNTPEGACPTCTGLGTIHQANVKRLVNDDLSIEDGAIHGWDANLIRYQIGILAAAAQHYGLAFDPSMPVKDYSPAMRDLLVFGVESAQFRRHAPDVETPQTVRGGRFEGVATTILRRYAEHIHDLDYQQKMAEFLVTDTCPDCEGTRIRPDARAVTVAGRTIIDVSRMALTDLAAWLGTLPDALQSDHRDVARSLLIDLQERIRRVIEVGVGYLTLDRASPSLSGGEARRLKMALLLGSSLTGLVYILDEPTIGLHERDTTRLIGVLKRLRDLGNTMLVIEHDLEVMRAADHIIDFGPGAGKYGGQVVATGTPDEIARHPTSITGAYLSGREHVPVPGQRRLPDGRWLTIAGARANNLKDITVRLPIGLLVAVTGVSGSGKSSLIFDILDAAGRQQFYNASDRPGPHDSIEGWEHFDKLITIGQESVVRIPRSNAATYTDTFTPIREVFAASPAARERKMTARHFSFNVPGGRCERCQGVGTLAVQMHFLPDVEVKCPACKGRRFKPETLAVTYRDHTIADVLDLTVDEALALFSDVPAAASRLQVMVDVGLGYMQLGQPAKTLSGGEIQRVKLSKELGRRASARTLYLLDEPTTGLHPADTARLMGVLQRLVDGGSTVVVVEHNLDLIAAADWVIDLGPEGGAEGGYIVAEGAPEQIAAATESYTGQYLRQVMA